MTLLASHGGAEVHHCDWRALLPIVEAAGGCDALICDAPYSDRTHSGHDVQVHHLGAQDSARRKSERRAIDYGAWGAEDVREFVGAWSPMVRGWFVSITDHALAIEWSAALEAVGRYVFAPLPLYSPGSRVRLAGDGPSSWTTWIVVARPRERRFMSWGTLPGGYTCAPERMPVVGGKPLAAMRALVSDYSRPGDLVVDPVCGGGTTPVAAQLEGRRAIGGDAMLEHAEIAAERIRPVPTQDRKGTLALFGGGT